MVGEELNKNHGVEVHCFEVDFLVNNAGIGGSNFFEDTDVITSYSIHYTKLYETKTQQY